MQALAQQQVSKQSSLLVSAFKPDRAAPRPAQSLSPILLQQQVMGNQAVQRMLQTRIIQAKLAVSEPGDRYEQEADRVADQVMRMPEPHLQRQVEPEEEEEKVQTKLIRDQITPLVQRQVEPEEEDEEKVQTKLIGDQFTPLIQRQVEPEEEDEEKVQTKLISDQFTPLIQRQIEPEEEDEEKVQTKLIGDQFTPLIQRQIEPEEEDEEKVQTKYLNDENPLIKRQKEKNFQTKGETGNHPPFSLPGSQLSFAQTTGFPLQEDIRSQMEAHFGSDFTHVRIHTDNSAHQMNQNLRAQAFTHGQDIYFREGYYNPGSYAGKRLLAHELVHVLQQGATSQKKTISNLSGTNLIQRMTWSEIGTSLTDLFTSSFLSLFEGLDALRQNFLRHLRDFARRVPGYRLLTVVLGRDPITDESVERNGRNFIEGGLDVIPGGRLLQRKLEETGALDEAAAWLDEQIRILDFEPAAIIQEFSQFLRSLELSDFGRPLSVLQRIQNIFQPPIERILRFAENVARRLLQIVKDYLISEVIDFIQRRTRAYPLIRIILRQDPISGEEVPYSTIELLRAFMNLSETGAEQLRQMEETGTLRRAASWIDNAVGIITGNVRRIIAAFSNIWDGVTIQNLMNPFSTFERIYGSFAEPIANIFSFLVQVGIQVLSFIKDALIQRLVGFAQTVRGYPLLTVILGKDPFSGETVLPTANNFIRGFLSFLSDGEERFRNLVQSGAIDRAMTWLSSEVVQLNLTWEAIRALFLRAWQRLSIGDLANPREAFWRMVNLFRGPVSRIIRFAGSVAMKILEFVFEGIMGAGGARVLNILKQGRDTFLTIINNPVGFLRNLIGAVVQGFRLFGQNIGRHLVSGLVGWLFGALQGAGLQLPERLDMRGVISLALQILGLTYQRIRPRLVRLLGERIVSGLESTFEVVRLLVTEGPAAIWEKIVEYAGNLRDQVVEGIRNWVITRVVISGVTYLASLFTPASAVVQAIRTTYNVIMWFIERIQQLMGLVEAITNSISNIASGNISAAANYVEQTLGRILPLIISLLARLLGLGGITDTIRRIIARIRRPIDRALDRAVRWIAGQARRLVRGGRAGGRAAVGPEATFEAAGERHRVWVQVVNNNPRLMISSEEEILANYFSGLEQRIRAMPENEQKRSLLERLTVARDTARRIQTGALRAAIASGAGSTIGRELDILINELRNIVIEASISDYNPGVYQYIVSGDRPMMAHGWMALSGGPAHVRIVGGINNCISSINNSNAGVHIDAIFHSGHLIGRQFGGSGGRDNLVPMEGRMNMSWYSTIEGFVRSRLQNNEMIHISLVVHYNDSRPFENLITDEDLIKIPRHLLADARPEFEKIPHAIIFTIKRRHLDNHIETLQSGAPFDPRRHLALSIRPAAHAAMIGGWRYPTGHPKAGRPRPAREIHG